MDDSAEFAGGGDRPDASGVVSLHAFFDALSRQCQEQFPKVTGETAQKVRMTYYDGWGHVTGEVDEAGLWTGFQYDLMGRLIAVTNDFKVVYPNNEIPMITRYVYDEAGNQIKQSDAQTDGTNPTPRDTIYEYDRKR